MLVSLVMLVLLVLCERSAGMNGLLEWLEFPTLGGNSFRDVAQRVVVVVRLRLLLRSNSRRARAAHQQPNGAGEAGPSLEALSPPRVHIYAP